MKKRYDVINYFLRTRGYQKYLEIGVFTGRCLRHVVCNDKTAVDPNPQTEAKDTKIHALTSDDFFATNKRKFDLVFIDGLHLADQVVKDIYNSLAVLEPGGTILMHDCSPAKEERQVREQGRAWNGDVWKAFAFVRAFVPEAVCRVLNTDHGIGVIALKQGCTAPAFTDDVARKSQEYFDKITWRDLETNRSEMLGLIHNRMQLEKALRSAAQPAR